MSEVSLILVQDPIRVFDNWKKAGLANVEELLDSYSMVLKLLNGKFEAATKVPLSKELLSKPEQVIRKIYEDRNVPFTNETLQLQPKFGSALFFPTDHETCIDERQVDRSSWPKTPVNTGGIDLPYQGGLSNVEKDLIEEQLGHGYLQHWGDAASRLRSVLSSKTWIGFDLDDTLHEFRRASAKATNRMLEVIHERHAIPVSTLKDEYVKILNIKTANAFADGKTSFEYRAERFDALLTHFSLSYNDQFLTTLQDTYENTLMDSLELKCGALSLLKAVKSMGKKVVVITEGPQDAQERTVERLGLSSYIDFLATSNNFRTTKTDGLVLEVARHLGISSGDMAYIGDNEERDIRPAEAEGIFAVHLAENKHVSLQTSPVVRINTLWKLLWLL